MPKLYEDRDRKIIPRWRLYGHALTRSELASTTSVMPERASGFECILAFHKREWEENTTLSFAADFVASSIVLGEPGVAVGAAEYVLAYAPSELESLRLLATEVMCSEARVSEAESTDLISTPAMIRARIHNLKRRLERNLRDAISWIDLAWYYEVLGQFEPASRAAKMAQLLAPSNRFVLRSVVRMFVHQRDPVAAAHLLENCARTGQDPWLLAAELATCAAAGRTSRRVKRASRVLEEGGFHPSHLSELASALATLELERGNRKKARRLLNQSLVAPTENAVAQAAWIGRCDPGLSIDPQRISAGPSSEARAWLFLAQGDWGAALRACTEWYDDQPFSSRPTILASFVASVCQQGFVEAERFAQLGLRANPGDPVLLNNFAFALALQDRVPEARVALARLQSTRWNHDRDAAVTTATNGLIEFRAGNADAGRELYQSAVARFDEAHDIHYGAIAKYYWAAEELRFGLPTANHTRDAALATLERGTAPELTLLAQRLRSKSNVSGT